MKRQDSDQRIVQAAGSSPSVKMTLAEVVRKGGAGPKAAAAYAAGIAYMWTEAIVRYLATNTSYFPYMVYSERTGDVVAIWLASILVSLLAFFIVWGASRGRTRVGSIALWTAILVASTIIGPLVGELGTPFGI
jgi:hypothetical protein